jgi:hypothetical protein
MALIRSTIDHAALTGPECNRMLTPMALSTPFGRSVARYSDSTDGMVFGDPRTQS